MWADDSLGVGGNSNLIGGSEGEATGTGGLGPLSPGYAEIVGADGDGTAPRG